MCVFNSSGLLTCVGTVNSGVTLDKNFLGHSDHVTLRKV